MINKEFYELLFVPKLSEKPSETKRIIIKNNKFNFANSLSFITKKELVQVTSYWKEGEMSSEVQKGIIAELYINIQKNASISEMSHIYFHNLNDNGTLLLINTLL